MCFLDTVYIRRIDELLCAVAYLGGHWAMHPPPFGLNGKIF